MKKHNVDCMVCGEELVYSSEDKEVKCIYCNDIYHSNVSCGEGHYICNTCHCKDSIDLIYSYCLKTDEKNPLKMAIELMKSKSVNMHGPEHHFLVPAILTTSYYNNIDKKEIKEEKLNLVRERATKIPGGICGSYGSCGAAVGTGLVISIITEATPLTEESWGLANEMTGYSLISMGKNGGPRCCKRNTFTAIMEASKFIEERLGVKLYDYADDKALCEFKKYNKQCIGKRCPFA